MSSIGLLLVTVLTLLLVALLDMKVYQESFASAIKQLSLGKLDNWKNYAFVAAAFALTLARDLGVKGPVHVRHLFRKRDRL